MSLKIVLSPQDVLFVFLLQGSLQFIALLPSSGVHNTPNLQCTQLIVVITSYTHSSHTSTAYMSCWTQGLSWNTSRMLKIHTQVLQYTCDLLYSLPDL